MAGVQLKKIKKIFLFKGSGAKDLFTTSERCFSLLSVTVTVAPLALNGNKGRPKGMAVLRSVRLCIHSE